MVANVVRYGLLDMVSCCCCCWEVDKLLLLEDDDILEDIAAGTEGEDQILEMISRLCLLTSFSFCESANLTTSGDEQP